MNYWVILSKISKRGFSYLMEWASTADALRVSSILVFDATLTSILLLWPYSQIIYPLLKCVLHN